MRAVLDLGADIVNDVWALRRAMPCRWWQPIRVWRLPDAHAPRPADHAGRAHGGRCAGAGARLSAVSGRRPCARWAWPRDRITLDPGIGFGKTVAQNFSLLARQAELLDLGYPVLAGWSRKSSLGAVTGRRATGRSGGGECGRGAAGGGPRARVSCACTMCVTQWMPSRSGGHHSAGCHRRADNPGLAGSWPTIKCR